jgi:hypothetical protein
VGDECSKQVLVDLYLHDVLYRADGLDLDFLPGTSERSVSEKRRLFLIALEPGSLVAFGSFAVIASLLGLTPSAGVASLAVIIISAMLDR